MGIVHPGGYSTPWYMPVYYTLGICTTLPPWVYPHPTHHPMVYWRPLHRRTSPGEKSLGSEEEKPMGREPSSLPELSIL